MLVPRDVVVDADREPLPRPLTAELSEHAGDHARRELLGGQAVAPADHQRHPRPLAAGVRLGQGRDDVEEQRLAERPGLLRAIEHGHPLDRRREGREQVPRPRTAGTAAPGRLPRARRAPAGGPTVSPTVSAAGAHDDEHPLGLAGGRVLEQVVAAAAALGEPAMRPARARARGRRTGSRSRAPGSRRRGSGRCRA